MPTGNPTHSLKLADREFKALTAVRPIPQPSRKFKPMKLNAARFDQSWDRKRGAAARLTAVVLREDDVTLERPVCESERSIKTYSSAADCQRDWPTSGRWQDCSMRPAPVSRLS